MVIPYNLNKKFLKIYLFGIIVSIIGLVSIDFIDKQNSFFFNPLSIFYLVHAQQQQSLNHSSTETSKEHNISTNHINTKQQQEKESHQIIKASGHFANNQMKGGVVTWIQGGLWSLDILSKDNKTTPETSNLTADFNANFTMIKPDGSLSHNHMIDNFVSNNIIFAGNDIIITGISDILFDNGTEYSKVPITVHLMGKKVLGLMIDVNKTNGHFSSSNEMFGTLISGIGLDKSNIIDNKNNPMESKGSSSMDSMHHMMH